jgi:NADH:ubiquinone oxidoreductase subunit 3 (subunit A)
LRVRIPWLFEVESVGLIPVVAAFLLCAMVIAGLAFRW